MPSLEEIIDRILAERPDLVREDIQLMIEQKRREVGGLLTNEGAAYIVASELGVSVYGEGPLRTEIGIRDLVPRANDISINGRVILVYPVQTFSRLNKTTGKLARMIIADSTGTLSVVLWDDKADLLKQITQNQIVRILHGYVRESLDGKPELHIGVRGDVLISPANVNPEHFPEVKEFFKKIDELNEDEKYVNVVALVSRVFPVATFQKETGIGKVSRLELSDDTGRVMAVLWNEKADIAKEVKRGDCLQIMGAKVKRGLQDNLEIHVERGAQVSILAEKPPQISLPAIKPAQIAKLKPGMADVDILARVVSIGSVREFRRPTKEVGHVATLIIKDATGSTRLTLWNEKTDVIERIRLGDIVLVESAYTKPGLGGLIDLNLGTRGVLTINPTIKGAIMPPPIEERIMPIGQLKQGLMGITVEGTITGTPLVRDVVTQRGETVKVASFWLHDATGKIRVSAWRNLANVVKDLPADSKIKLRSVYVKAGLNGTLEISSGTMTTIEVLSQPTRPNSSNQIVIE